MPHSPKPSTTALPFPVPHAFAEPGHPRGETAEVLERIGRRWALMILDALYRRGTLRHNEIRRAVDGIPQRMLTLALRELERDGVLARKPRATIPPWVDYELTALGRSLMEPLRALHGWARTHRGAILAARERFDGRDA